jgi:hypothetical protein
MVKGVDVKKSIGLSKSTKTLLIIVIVIMVIAVIFLVIRGLSNPNDNGNPVDRLTADLKISQVEILNNTNLNVKVEEGIVEGEIQAINFIFYNEDGKEIKRSKVLISDLEENDFLVSFRVANTSKIKSISIIPIFVNKSSGGSVIGKVEDEYTITSDENTEEELPEENTSIEVIPECTLDLNCNDNNGCTTDSCVEGNCSHTLVENCVPCSLSSQCEDSNACTTNSCSEGKCVYLSIPGCTPCGSSANCNDSGGCIENICMQGRCLYTSKIDCKACTIDSECEDNDACTSNICSNGACTFTSISNCKVCTLSSQCEDNDSSTTSSCSGGKCVYTKIISCISNDLYCPTNCVAGNDNDCPYICGNGIREGKEKCDGVNLGGATCSGVLGIGYTGQLKCFSSLCTFDTSLCIAPCTCSDDGNSCTSDGCVNGICKHTSLTGNSCLSDSNVCTNDICGVNGTCAHAPISGCCTSSSQCGSGKVCTGNICVSSSSLPPNPGTGKIYYLSPSGSDSNGNGSIQKPWYSLEKAWNYIAAGDTIYMRGGTYKYTDTINLEDKSGTPSKMINIFNYPGEHPIIDYKGVDFGSQTQCFGLFLRNDNYLHFKGIRVTNAAQVNEIDAQPNYGMILWTNVDNSIFEQMETDHIGGWGVVIGDNSDNNLFLNCDSHHNADPYSTEDPYGGSDGFQTGSPTSNNNTFRGCRAWMNSDDGWDFRQSAGLSILENCWAFNNGYNGGNGEGFKLGGSNFGATSATKRIVRNCLAVGNIAGIESSTAEMNYVGVEIYNSVFYNNYVGFNLQTDGPVILKNNIVYDNYDNYGLAEISTHNHNTVDSNVYVNDSDFLSVDSAGMDGARAENGSLPNLNFLRLRQGSDLIDAGINVGLPFKGNAPDLGAFETDYGAVQTPTCSCSSDGNVCTTDICQSNVCQHIVINGCCTSSSQCGSEQTCTGNVCVTSSTPPPTSTTGNTYYVATNGKDTNSGTSINSPFATINKAWSMVSAGDIIYVRGGTYTYSVIKETVLSDRSGTAGKMINIWNYPGEKPIIDFSANTFTSQVMGIRLQNANYIYIKGIRVTSINQPHQGGIAQYGMILWDHVSNSIFEQVETDHIGGWGVVIGSASNNNLFLNCDSHHNSDRYSTNGEPWGWSDGFQSNSWDSDYVGQTSTNNIFRGCRSYWNSDDGWDLRRAQGVWTFENCWAFWNGYRPGEKIGDSDLKIEGGNGEGLKVSGNFGGGSNEIRRIVTNTLSFENSATGYGLWSDKPEGNPIGIHIYNSVAYKNNNGWGCSDNEGVSTTAFKNDISFANTNGNYWPSIGTYWFIHNNNNWDIPITVTNSDFLSVDSSCMDDERKADGSLPDCPFLHLAKGSKLIDAGVNVGLPYNGKAPDLGAYESSY